MLQNRNYTGIRKLINRWEQIIENKSDAIFTYSNQGKEYYLSRGIPEQKIFVGVNVIDTNRKLIEIQKYRFKKTDFSYDFFFNIAFIGSITPEKNLDILINTVKELNIRNGKKAVLHIIGDGKHKVNLVDLVDKLMLGNNVLFHGRINEGASAILQHCDVMVLPGLGGLAICDAMLNSLPVITGLADGTELDLVDESNGFIIPDLDEIKLLEKLEYLLNNPTEAALMGKNSYLKITTRFSFDNYYSKFNEAIDFTLKQ